MSFPHWEQLFTNQTPFREQQGATDIPDSVISTELRSALVLNGCRRPTNWSVRPRATCVSVNLQPEAVEHMITSYTSGNRKRGELMAVGQLQYVFPEKRYLQGSLSQITKYPESYIVLSVWSLPRNESEEDSKIIHCLLSVLHLTETCKHINVHICEIVLEGKKNFRVKQYVVNSKYQYYCKRKWTFKSGDTVLYRNKQRQVMSSHPVMQA